MNLGEMPLDSADHVRHAWHLVTGMDWRRRRAIEKGLPPDPFLPGEEQLKDAMIRIREAAVKFDVSLGESAL